jgi:hypothetical protein
LGVVLLCHECGAKTYNLKGTNNMGLRKPISPDPGVRRRSIEPPALQAADVIVNDARARSRDFTWGACRIGGASCKYHG